MPLLKYVSSMSNCDAVINFVKGKVFENAGKEQAA